MKNSNGWSKNDYENSQMKSMKATAQQVHDENATSDQFAVSQTPYHTHNGTDSQRIPFIGLSDTPITYHGAAGQVAMVNDSESGLIFSDPVVTTYYKGVVTSNAAGTPFPSGWSVAHGETGEYTITHDLDTTDYTLAIVPHATSCYFMVNPKGANSFTMFFYTSPTALTDTDFDFTVFT